MPWVSPWRRWRPCRSMASKVRFFLRMCILGLNQTLNWIPVYFKGTWVSVINFHAYRLFLTEGSDTEWLWSGIWYVSYSLFGVICSLHLVTLYCTYALMRIYGVHYHSMYSSTSSFTEFYLTQYRQNCGWAMQASIFLRSLQFLCFLGKLSLPRQPRRSWNSFWT